MINKIFLEEKNVEKVSNDMIKNSIIKMDNFLDSYSKMKEKISKLKFIEKRVPDKFSYSEAKSSFFKNLFNSSEFIDYMGRISGVDFKKVDVKVLKFRHKNYTLMHDSLKSEESFHFVLFFCDGWDVKYGGNKVIIKGEKNFVLTPSGNSLVFFRLDERDREFFQYIKHFTGKSEFFVIEGSLK